MVQCRQCGSENADSKRFCADCGVRLPVICGACGSPSEAGKRFCGDCGSPLARTSSGANGGAEVTALGPETLVPETLVSERRLVSVLFVDLVGFTSFAESRDPEEVRELLSSYFDAASALVERYGGTVEKFIGDAVMAMWGAPVANEDDAERAVRTALDLVEAVAAIGQEAGAPDLMARAGVLTGEAVVNLQAQGQGMVAGDLVNTASRIQSAAEPGGVFVGEATRRATEAAIAYRDAGPHKLKGKDEPVALYRALRVVAGVGGLMKSDGLEPPFVGRERELKFVKELFHHCSEDRRAHLVQVSGIAGIGKSRLVWELFKYIDGLRSTYFWHRGRCLAYGEGVTYWALSEMVRSRAGITEGEDRSSAAEKLHAIVTEHIADPEDRRFAESRLAQLVGLEEGASSDRQELFAAWRLFFEHLAEEDPVVMVFEDMQWADPSLIELIEYLLDWSRNHPLFVMTVSRPDSPAASLASAKRNATSLYLEPLSDVAMSQLLEGFVPGLPVDLAERILERAEGVPLYAVETIRMLIDRGHLVQEGPVYRPSGPIESLEMPETLHALIAARLDGLSPDERLLVQDASVIGKTFARKALAAVSGADEDRLDALIASLVGKEVFLIQADPRERGQFGFLQDLVRTVAYETLSRRDRKQKHLRMANYLEQNWESEEEETVEVVASHLLDAYSLDEKAADARVLRERARIMLSRAGERAASLGASEKAQSYFEQAAGLSDSITDKAEMSERAGQMADRQGRSDDAGSRYDQATRFFEQAGHVRAAQRCQARLAWVDGSRGHLDQAIERMTKAHAAMAGAEPDPDLATVAAQLGRFFALAGRHDEATTALEEALELAEHLELPEIYSEALNSKAISLIFRGRNNEAGLLLRGALEVALEHDLNVAALRTYNNLHEVQNALDGFAEAVVLLDSARELAQRVGNRTWELISITGTVGPLVALGRWDEALQRAEEAQTAEELASLEWVSHELLNLVPLYVRRGQLSEASELLVFRELPQSSDPQVRALQDAARAELLRAQGKPGEALAVAETWVTGREEIGLSSSLVKRCIVQALEATFELGDMVANDEILHMISRAHPGEATPWFRGQVARLSARRAASRGESDAVEPGFSAAEHLFRRLETPFDLGVALLEHAEWLVENDREEDAQVHGDEAASLFAQLRARPWLERLDSLRKSKTGITR